MDIGQLLKDCTNKPNDLFAWERLVQKLIDLRDEINKTLPLAEQKLEKIRSSRHGT